MTMKRSLALEHIRIAGINGDREAYTRLYIENRVSFAAAKKAYEEGVKMRGFFAAGKA